MNTHAPITPLGTPLSIIGLTRSYNGRSGPRWMEAARAELYATKSRPFDRPDTGKIAVKVINHYGDEVLKVFGVG